MPFELSLHYKSSKSSTSDMFHMRHWLHIFFYGPYIFPLIREKIVEPISSLNLSYISDRGNSEQRVPIIIVNRDKNKQMTNI